MGEEKRNAAEQTGAMTAEELDRALTEKIGVQVDYGTLTGPNILKWLIFSGLGVFIFFINITVGGGQAVHRWC